MDAGFGQAAADFAGGAIPMVGEHVPDLLLAGMVVRHAERYQLFERHLIPGIEIVQIWRDSRQTKPLPDDRGRRHEPRRYVLEIGAQIDQHLHRTELVERMELLSEHILGERVLLRRRVALTVRRAHDTGHRAVLREPLLLDQQLEGAEASSARRYLEYTRLIAITVHNRPDIEAQQTRA